LKYHSLQAFSSAQSSGCDYGDDPGSGHAALFTP
jgi:hypothetical protein